MFLGTSPMKATRSEKARSSSGLLCRTSPGLGETEVRDERASTRAILENFAVVPIVRGNTFAYRSPPFNAEWLPTGVYVGLLLLP
jgi:hypothetical protein